MLERNLNSHVVLYKGEDPCFLNPDTYKTADEKTSFFNFLDIILPYCHSVEEKMILEVVQNANIDESVTEIITKQGGAYFSASGEIVPMYEFTMAGFSIAGMIALANTPMGSVAILPIVTAIAMITTPYLTPEISLQGIQRTMAAVRFLLTFNRELSMLRPPLQSLGMDIDWTDVPPEIREKLDKLIPVGRINRPEAGPEPPGVDRDEWIDATRKNNEAIDAIREAERKRYEEALDRRLAEIAQQITEEIDRTGDSTGDSDSIKKINPTLERPDVQERLEESERLTYEEIERIIEQLKGKFELWKASLEQAMGTSISDEDAMKLLGYLDVDDFPHIYKTIRETYERQLGEELTDQQDGWLLTAKKDLSDKGYLQKLLEILRGRHQN